MSQSLQASKLIPPHSNEHLDFALLTDPYRRELLVHCYRMLGSLEDGEDALQETLLRAWRQFDTLRSPAALRAWLYKIATNVALNMLAHRRVRTMPPAITEPANPQDALQAPPLEAVWLDPLPDEYLAGDSTSPEACYESKESVKLAFLAALQLLPGRQRAILIMRDVLGWNTTEIGTLLDQSVPAVNSALQRARATMKKYYHNVERPLVGADDQRVLSLLTRYVQAWEASDSASLVMLLREDAILTMPPLPGWFRGRDAIKEFFDLHIFSPAHSGKQFRVVTVRANGSPALASYQRDEAGIYRPGAILVLTIEGDEIVQIDDFLALDNRLFLRFNLPLFL